MVLNRLGSDLASSDESSYILAALAVKLAEMPEGELSVLIKLGKEHVYEENGRVYCVKEPDSSQKDS